MSTVNLGPVISAVDRVARQLEYVQNDVAQVRGEVGQVSSDLKSTSRELLELRREFTEFVLQAERTANIQRSETKLGNLKAELDREFGHYAIVRRTSVGMLQAFDIGIVTNKTVQQVSEELMISTPRYWLAPALVALAAWSRDDEKLAAKAVEEAYNRDQQKTSLLFALVLRRQGRNPAATRWVRHYFTSLDPRSLPRDFAVVMEALAQDGFGAEGRKLMADQLVDWLADLRDDPKRVAAQVATWKREVANHRCQLRDADFKVLAEFSPDWPDIKEQLERASAYGEVLRKYEAIKDTPGHISARLEDQMDDLLEQLVSEYDAEELPLKREIVYHEAVIDHGGDLDRAQQEADLVQGALEETIDALTLQTYSALSPGQLGVSVQTQQLAIAASKAEFDKAVSHYAADYRANALDAAEIELGPDHSNYAQSFKFGTWQASTATDQRKAEESLNSAWDQVLATYLEAIRFKWSAAVLPGLLALIVTVIAVLIPPHWPGIIVLLLAGGAAGLYVWNKKNKADRALAEAEATREKAKAHSRSIYRAALAEFVDATLLYEEKDSEEAAVHRFIRTWSASVEGLNEKETA